MKVTIEGIVLNETNYSETSKILNILTKEYGYISVMSKGSRTIKSKLRGISMKLIYANFTINYKEKGISTLIEGSLIDSLKYIMTDYTKMIYANKLVNICKNVLKENQDPLLFDILKFALLKINQGMDPKIMIWITEIKFLTFLGVAPLFTSCINCGNSEIKTFDINRGGVICSSCYKDEYIFSKTTLKLLKLFQMVDISKIDKLNIQNKKVLEELNQFINEYYEKYTGIYLEKKS